MADFERVVLGDDVTLYRGDCLEVLPTLGEVNAIIADPPYNGILDDAWDNAWESRQHYLDWLGVHFDAWYKALRFNGSLCCFAYPYLAAYVEVELGKRFNVLNHIVWDKRNGGTASRSRKEALPRLPAFVGAHHLCGALRRGQRRERRKRVGQGVR